MTCGHRHRPPGVGWLAYAILAGLGVVALACAVVLACVDERSPLVGPAVAGLFLSVSAAGLLWSEP